MLTQEQEKGILTGTIEKLTKQAKTMQEMVDKLVTQINEATEKRKVVLEAIDRERIEFDAEKKKIGEERGRLEALRFQNAKDDQRVKILQQKLAEDKANYNESVKQFDKRKNALDQKEGLLVEHEKSLDRREKDLEKALEDVDVQKTILLKKEKEIEDTWVLIAQSKDELKARENDLNIRNKDLLETEAGIDKKARSNDSKLAADREKLAKDRQEFENDRTAAEKALQDRELLIIRKEKELDNGFTSLKAQKEKLELEEGRKTRKGKKNES